MGIIKIGITGHRDLLASDSALICQTLEKCLTEINVSSSTIIVGNAAGADQLAKETAQKLDIPVIDLDQNVLRKPGEADGDYYSRQADYLTKECDFLIALWDGVFSGKRGGTSEVVKRFINAVKPKVIHHLITPRESNLYPISSLSDEVIDFSESTFNRIPFTVHYSWLIHNNPGKKKVSFFKKLFLLGKQWIKSSLFWIYLLPILLVLITLGLGTWGFVTKNEGDTAYNHFFNALNLITFDGSVIESNSNWKIDSARIMALLLVFSAFAYGFYLALKKQRIKLIRRLWRRNFYLITGLTPMSIRLAKNIAKSSHVVLLHQESSNPVSEYLDSEDNIISFQADLVSKKALLAANALHAKGVFLMHSEEEINVRSGLEIDTFATEAGAKVRALSVQVNREENRRLLQQSLTAVTLQNTRIFNVEENTVRRLLLLYPPDRFYQSLSSLTKRAVCVNVIIGWNELSRQMVLSMLRQGHYTRSKKLKIRVLCKGSEENKNTFLTAFPLFDSRRDEYQVIKEYTWSGIELEFYEMPSSDYDWLDDKNPFLEAITKDSIVNAYFTLENSIRSSAILDIVMPKLNNLKNVRNNNLQVFYFYNFPDKHEEANTEAYFNRKAPKVFLKCFGNYREECSLQYLKSSSIDALAMLINAKYAGVSLNNKEKIAQVWFTSSEKNKSSSRQAADHLWVKLRLLWPLINWKFDPVTFEPQEEAKKILFDKKNVKVFAEIEHRRWCAEQLLWGVKPITENSFGAEFKEMARRWNSDLAWKNCRKDLLEHIDLVPFADLPEHEVQKDVDQLMAIPEFLRNVIKNKT